MLKIITRCQQLTPTGWPHQRENAVSDGGVSRDLDFVKQSKVREFIARHMYSLEDVIVGAGHFTAAIRLLPICPTAESC